MVKMLDLARMLAEREDVEQSKAASFVECFFNQIVQSLPSERLVKISGLGTFKVQQVKARESVSVNSGERLLIESHDRISFVPDKSLRDAVNKPFAAFETVEINSGVDFSAIDAALSTPTVEDKDDDEQKEEPVEAGADEQETQLVDEEKQQEVNGEPAETETQIPDAVEENKVQDDADAEDESEDNGDKEEEEDEGLTKDYLEERLDQSKNRLRCWIVGATLVVLVVGIAAFFLGRQIAINSERSSTSQQAIISSLRSELAKVKGELSLAQKSPDTVVAVKTTKQVADSNKSVDTTKAVEEKPKSLPVPKYGEDDPEVRHGAYIILGIDKTVKARKGQTLSSISKANYGPGMECYVRAVNPGVATLEVGQDVNLPKLKLKRKKR